MLNLYLNEAATPEKALVFSAANPSPIPMRSLIFGEQLSANIFLVDGNSGYSAASGAVGSTVNVGIGVLNGVPSGGKYTLTFGAQTTDELSHNSTAAQVQAALEALSSVGSGNVLVTGEFPSFQVEFVGDLELAAQSAITGNGDGLTPKSDIVVDEIQPGSGSLNEIQVIRLETEISWLNTSWTRSAGPPAKWSGTLSATGLKVFQLFNGRAKVTARLEVRITDASGFVKTYASIPFELIKTIIPSGALSTTPDITRDGEVEIDDASEIVEVTGLNLPVTPRQVWLQVIKPVGGLNLYATREGELTTDGFTAVLNGQTDSADYKLAYLFTF